jgi:hypothetical protein
MRLGNVLLTLGIALSAYAQQNEGWRGAQCIESLQVPTYPVVARLARIAGTARVQAVVSGGAIAALEFDESLSPLLRDAVEKSIRASRFSPKCDRTTLEIVFAFVIQGDPVAYQDPGVVTYRWPNQFTISARPPIPNPEIENLGPTTGVGRK